MQISLTCNAVTTNLDFCFAVAGHRPAHRLLTDPRSREDDNANITSSVLNLKLQNFSPLDVSSSLQVEFG